MILFLLFILQLSPLFGQEFYESDGLGLKGPQVDSIQDAPWVLEVNTDEFHTNRILYKEQSEYKRWEVSQQLVNDQYLSRERYYYKDSLRTDTISNQNDQIVEEILYDSNGKFLVKKVYKYDESGKLRSIDHLDDQGFSTDELSIEYRLNGSLRSLKSNKEESIEWRTGDFEQQYLETLYLEDEDRTTLFKYEENKLVEHVIYSAQSMIEKTVYDYSSSGVLLQEIKTKPSDKSESIIRYDDLGRVISKNIYRNNVLEFSELNSYTQDKLTRTIQRSSGLVLLSEYTYKPEEEDPYLSLFYRNGNLSKRLEKTDDGIRETLYRNNESVLERFIEDDES
jgi:antitoxin component YwqK of YwqJK toxin-antitoxin module